MKNLLCILLLVSLSGCVSEKQCLRKYPPQITEVEKVITNTIIKTRDTIIYKEIQGETKYFYDTVIVTKDGLVNTRPSVLETTLAISQAQVVNNRLQHELRQKDTMIELRLKDALKEIETLEQRLNEKVTTIEVPAKISRWNKMLIALGWLTLGGLFSFLALVLLRK
jgi:hypothetical protein